VVAVLAQLQVQVRLELLILEGVAEAVAKVCIQQEPQLAALASLLFLIHQPLQTSQLLMLA
jgi:hypothetical protein